MLDIRLNKNECIYHTFEISISLSSKQTTIYGLKSYIFYTALPCFFLLIDKTRVGAEQSPCEKANPIVAPFIDVTIVQFTDFTIQKYIVHNHSIADIERVTTIVRCDNHRCHPSFTPASKREIKIETTV